MHLFKSLDDENVCHDCVWTPYASEELIIPWGFLVAEQWFLIVVVEHLEMHGLNCGCLICESRPMMMICTPYSCHQMAFVLNFSSGGTGTVQG